MATAWAKDATSRTPAGVGSAANSPAQTRIADGPASPGDLDVLVNPIFDDQKLARRHAKSFRDALEPRRIGLALFTSDGFIGDQDQIEGAAQPQGRRVARWISGRPSA
jgi:hypothetical protein